MSTSAAKEETCNYVTCLMGHKVFMVWLPEQQRFTFTCDECGLRSVRAVCARGVIDVSVVRTLNNE